VVAGAVVAEPEVVGVAVPEVARPPAGVAQLLQLLQPRQHLPLAGVAQLLQQLQPRQHLPLVRRP
jgi:hypothetical protein